MKILIITVLYDEKNWINSNLTMLQNSSLDFKWIVVVNNHKINDLTFLNHDFVTVIKNKHNNGFAKAVNQAIGQESSRLNSFDWVWLLNPDAQIESISVDKFQHENSFDIWSCPIYDANGKIWFAGGKIDLLTGECFHLQRSNLGECDWISGCSMFIRPNIFEKIGLFDEKFFLFYEDVDFCFRAKEQNFQIGVIEDKRLKIVHYASESVRKIDLNQKYQIEMRSKFHFMKKHWKRFCPCAFFISWFRSIKNYQKIKIKNSH